MCRPSDVPAGDNHRHPGDQPGAPDSEEEPLVGGAVGRPRARAGSDDASARVRTAMHRGGERDHCEQDRHHARDKQPHRREPRTFSCLETCRSWFDELVPESCAGWLLARLPPSPTVELLAQVVEMTGVTRGLFDYVSEHPSDSPAVTSPPIDAPSQLTKIVEL